MDRECKRRRAVDALGSVRSVNRSVVLSVLRVFEPDSDLTRRDLDQSTRSLGADLTREISLPRVNAVGAANLAIARVQEVLPYTLIHCPGFRNAFASALARHPNSREHPWRLILYMDEITPGNPLHLESHKKVTAIYSSFLELADALRYEELWLVNGCIRTTEAHTIQGGLSAIIKQLMRAMFCEADSLQDAGIVIMATEAGPQLFFIKFHLFIGDEAASKSLWGHKSASAHRPCFDCKNVVNSGDPDNPEILTLLDGDENGYLVDLACVDRSRFDENSDADVWRDYDALAEAVAAGVGKERLKLLQQCRGMNYDPHGLIADRDLRRFVQPSKTTRDPMHVVLANGVMNVDVYLLLEAFREELPDFSYEVVAGFVSCDWRFPRQGGSLAYVFSASRERSSRKDHLFKSSASELLKLYPILRHFVQTVVMKAGLCTEACDCFLALCRVVDIMQKAKFGPTEALLRSLDAAIDAYRGVRHRIYGRDYIRPKHHYLFHITKQPLRDMFWLDCYTHERKHQLIKAAIQDIDNLASYERSCLDMVLTKTLAQQRDFAFSKLEPPVHAHHELGLFVGAPCEVSRSMRCDGVHFSDRCVVMSDRECGLIKVLYYNIIIL